MKKAIHPATEALLRFFDHQHLPKHLVSVSRPFGQLADMIAVELEGPEATVAIRKLLEAKDAAVRAALGTER